MQRTFLQTPHSGYHWDAIAKKYFEGWYLRVTLPEIEQTFAFMYSIENPLGGDFYSGGAVQILGIDEQSLGRAFPNVKQFWASRDRLSFGHWNKYNSTIDSQRISENFFDTRFYPPNFEETRFQSSPLFKGGLRGERGIIG